MDDLAGTIQPTALADALSERYLAYALSTIMSRSLPDVRDGLKPVHRRLIYAMHQLKLDPTAGFKKCARVIGDVIGKYHPHGDASVYEALVRLAQDFAARFPLVEGQGNFGNIDGDNAAAMRYTEARLTEAARRPALRHRGRRRRFPRRPMTARSSEPVVHAGRHSPTLLANGADRDCGRHGDLDSTAQHRRDLCGRPARSSPNPESGPPPISWRFMPGPDFPTGGILVEDPVTRSPIGLRDSAAAAFACAPNGSVERGKHGSLAHPSSPRLPYQVAKARLIEQTRRIARGAKKLPLLGDVRDESTEEIPPHPRTEIARHRPRTVLMQSMFRATAAGKPLAAQHERARRATRTPIVHGPEATCCRHWLDHRRRGARSRRSQPSPRRDRAPASRSSMAILIGLSSISTKSSASSVPRMTPRAGLMQHLRHDRRCRPKRC